MVLLSLRLLTYLDMRIKDSAQIFGSLDPSVVVSISDGLFLVKLSVSSVHYLVL